MKKHGRLAICCSLFLFTGCVNEKGHSFNQEKLAQADVVIAQAMEEGHFPGAVLAVVNDDKIEYLKAYGNKSVYPDTVPMSTNTIFDMASVSKCVGTTLAFMQLVENGQVRLSDPVSRYIPGFKPWYKIEKVGNGKHEVITDSTTIRVSHLLTHTSGLPSYVNATWFSEQYGENNPDAFINYIAKDLKRSYEPNTRHLYSCLNFITLHNIIENVTGMKFSDYVQQNVFDKLGLENTCYNPSEELYDRIAPTEITDGEVLIGKVHDPLARVVNGGNSGNAGVFSNAEDLAVIASALMNGGEYKGKRILSELTVKTMATVPENVKQFGRALGWDKESGAASLKGDLLSDNTICHTGYTGTSMVIDFDNKIAIILLTNRVHPNDKGSCARVRAQVANIVAGAVE